MSIKEESKLKNKLDNGITEDNFVEFLNLLVKEKVLLPMNGNKVIFLDNEENADVYVPLFTDKSEVKDFEYTMLDEVELPQIIDEIYDTGKFHAISLNPFTHDFIMNDRIIELVRSQYKVYKLNEVKKCYEELDKFANLKFNSIQIEVSNHKDIPKLSDNKMGIYIYIYGNKYLKIGKAWTNSDARWKYQHYSFKSSDSNLALSIKNDKDFCRKNNINIEFLNEKEQAEIIRNFIKTKVKRINIIIDREKNEEDYFKLNLLEAWLHYKLKPKYEGHESERKK